VAYFRDEFYTIIQPMAQALYRKYRPKKLEDVLGQETNVEILKNAAKTGRLGQAYIFHGPRGTGKTTTARLLAKLLNCEKRRTDPAFAKLGEPCNECRECKEIDTQNSFDVIEIDAASNRGIDEIRDLKESIKTSPAIAEHKVYIIDEAHMLTGAAFNALLKTLEEPPSHVVFIFATTEMHKLPDTILSRCQKFFFKKIATESIATHLKKIVKDDGFESDEGAIYAIARAGDGSMRDALSILDQAIASTSDHLTADSVRSLIGSAPSAATAARSIRPSFSKSARAHATASGKPPGLVPAPTLPSPWFR